MLLALFAASSICVVVAIGEIAGIIFSDITSVFFIVLMKSDGMIGTLAANPTSRQTSFRRVKNWLDTLFKILASCKDLWISFPAAWSS